MSKTNKKRLKFQGRADSFWKNKLRLYIILHGLSERYSRNRWSPCHLCHWSMSIGTASFQCRKLITGGDRWLINKDFSDMKREDDLTRSFKGHQCMEWIANV